MRSLLEFTIFGIILIVLISTGSSLTVLETEVVNYQNGTMELEKIRINYIDDAPSHKLHNPEFKVEAYSSGNKYWNNSFNITFRKYLPPVAKYREVNKTFDMVRIPINYSGTTIRFYREGKRVKELDLEDIDRIVCSADNQCSSYCQTRGTDPDCTCGDGVCQDHENVDTCYEDCSSVPGEDEGGETGGGDDEESSEVNDGGGFTWVYGIVAVFVGIFLWLYFRSDL